jgi:hypothetical protein
MTVYCGAEATAGDFCAHHADANTWGDISAIERLAEKAREMQRGALTEEEFADKKAELLSSTSASPKQVAPDVPTAQIPLEPPERYVVGERWDGVKRAADREPLFTTTNENGQREMTTYGKVVSGVGAVVAISYVVMLLLGK